MSEKSVQILAQKLETVFDISSLFYKVKKINLQTIGGICYFIFYFFRNS